MLELISFLFHKNLIKFKLKRINDDGSLTSVSVLKHTLSKKMRFSLGGEMHHAFPSRYQCVGEVGKRQTYDDHAYHQLD